MCVVIVCNGRDVRWVIRAKMSVVIVRNGNGGSGMVATPSK